MWWYKLDDQCRPVKIGAQEAEHELMKDRTVAVASLLAPDGTEVRVSTVFLVLDHALGHGKPILWETMIFGGEDDGLTDRYTSLENAEIGHIQMVRYLLDKGYRFDIQDLSLLEEEELGPDYTKVPDEVIQELLKKK